MQRYIRAFFVALKMTIQGKKIVRPYDSLWAWMEEAHQLAHSAQQAAQSGGIGQTALKIEGREVTLHTILTAVVYHTGEEYPYLLHNLTEHSLTAIYASNMNDQFNVLRLHNSEVVAQAAPEIQHAISALHDHLNAIPPSNTLESQPVVR